MMRHLYAPLALCLLLGACSTYGVKGTTPTAFDGKYNGTVNSTSVGAATCANTEPKPGTLTVENGTVEWTKSPTGTIFAPVSSDGSFAVSSVPSAGGITWFTGKITNHEMVARVNTGSCHQIYDLRKDTPPA